VIQYLPESLPRERSECFGYHHRVFDARNHLHGATAFPAGFDVDKVN
jgi:hypothetical protein